ncbi:MAG: hypothetical protein WCJ30_20955 [Deltaproteobacteria bacterium]
MPPLLILIAFLAGLVVGGVIVAAVTQRRRAAVTRAMQQRVLPVLERRALTLNLPTQSSPQVNVSGDGELQLDADDPWSRVLRLADAIDEHEHSQVGFVDTIRISKNEVDAQVSRTNRKKTG